MDDASLLRFSGGSAPTNTIALVGKQAAHELQSFTAAMILICLLLSTLSALAFYLATTHQRLLPAWRAWAPWLRLAGWISAALSVFPGAAAIGLWPGIFCSLTHFMLVAVLLPYLDAWRGVHRGRKDVG